jgi:GT2 family glycosyltransferase
MNDITPPENRSPAENEAIVADLRRQVSERDRRLAEKEAVIQEILNSRSWRLIQRFQNVRLRLIPRGSRREQHMYSAMRGLKLLRRSGLVVFSRRLSEKVAFRLRHAWQRFRLRLLRRPVDDRAFQVQPVLAAPVLQPHTPNVDIIVCVHNAPRDVQICLESVVRYTPPPYNLILVDDGSDLPTQQYLEGYALSQAANLLRNEQAGGYTRAANQGLRAATAEYCLLLNSDTIVTPGWLDRLVACGESDPRIGVVGPLSNTASWQSIPEIYNADGDWAENPLPQGFSAVDQGCRIAAYSGRVYPYVSFLNGFCLLIKRNLIDHIGIFDEENFGEGYAEENDYCLRAAKAGWKLAVADDAYVYHAQSRSYSTERRKLLVARSDKIFGDKHGHQVIREGIQHTRYGHPMQGVRARSQVIYLRSQLVAQGKERWEGKRLAVLLPIAEISGGGHVIMQEALAMQQMGVAVDLLNLQGHQSFFERTYPDLPLPRVYLNDPRHATSLLHKYDAAIGTLYNSLPWMASSHRSNDFSRYIRAYYIQDFEPDFFSPTSSEHKQALASYTLFPDLLRLTKTEWTRQAVQQHSGADSTVIGPSVDIDLFRPRRPTSPSWPARPLRIAAMIRPSTPRRQPGLTMQVLREISKKHGSSIEIILFGCAPHEPGFMKLERDFPWRHAGLLTPAQLANLLNEVDIFVDFSSFQAMGLTAMEAMACGAAVIVPQAGGASSFARHEENALVSDTNSAESCTTALDRLIRDETLRFQLQQAAMFDVCQYFPEKAAFNILTALFPDEPTALAGEAG